MDLIMPIMNGWEVTEKIREFEQNNSCKPCHICGITSCTESGNLLFIIDINEKCLNSGMNEYLQKPVDMKKLINIIFDIKHL